MYKHFAFLFLQDSKCFLKIGLIFRGNTALCESRLFQRRRSTEVLIFKKKSPELVWKYKTQAEWSIQEKANWVILWVFVEVSPLWRLHPSSETAALNAVYNRLYKRQQTGSLKAEFIDKHAHRRKKTRQSWSNQHWSKVEHSILFGAKRSRCLKH